MSHEIEAKFDVDDFRAVRRVLRQAAARYIATVVQTDTYYDTSTGMLRGRNCGLRIREVHCLRRGDAPVDTRPVLTAKGPPRLPASSRDRSSGVRRAKVRRELQTHLDDPEAVCELFEAMGLRRTMTVQKRRATYRLRRCMIELDELPVIGRYVEIEAPSERKLDAMRRRLNLPGEPITDHYLNLLARAANDSRRRTFLLES
ncbi:MAG: class IV adenylate cyclase [Phycisphaerae bacterium]|nr:class IV adenylate cyclase [Phycisphaerae bacterium]